jgi:hypothetical protein
MTTRGGYFLVWPAAVLLHPKFTSLSMAERGAWLTVRALEETLDDPFSREAARNIGVSARQLDKLLAVGLLDVLEDGALSIHDLSDHAVARPSDSPEARRLRQQKHRAKHVTRDTALVTSDPGQDRTGQDRTTGESEGETGRPDVEPIPICPIHDAPMKPSKGGGWFCSKKLTNGTYCKHNSVKDALTTEDPFDRAQRVRDEADRIWLEREQERRRRIDAGEEV